MTATGLTPGEAARLVLATVRRQPSLRVPLDDALGSILAEELASPIDLPPQTNSAMDGYATRSGDVRGASRERPVTLRVVGEIPAGGTLDRTVGPGECARIFTGGPLPDGADGVVRQEDTDEGRETVRIFDDRDAGSNFRLAGEDIRRGAVPIPAGAELGPAELGVLASLGVANPMVIRRPVVAILASGDEIADLDRADAIRAGTRIGSSNTHTLTALIRQAGGEVLNLGIAADTAESTARHLARAGEADLLVSTAGISVGEHDHLRGTLERLGARIHFWRLKMRPGAPVGFGELGRVPWLGLPGNPVSTMVTFELFVRPAIRAMMGHARPFRATTRVRAAERITLRPRLQHFLRGIVDDDGRARLTGPQGSGILTSMVAANALLVVPEGQHETPEGDELDAVEFATQRHVAEPPW